MYLQKTVLSNKTVYKSNLLLSEILKRIIFFLRFLHPIPNCKSELYPSNWIQNSSLLSLPEILFLKDNTTQTQNTRLVIHNFIIFKGANSYY